MFMQEVNYEDVSQHASTAVTFC